MIIRRSEPHRIVRRHNGLVPEHQTVPARALPSAVVALLAVAAFVVGVAVLKALVSVIGMTGVVMLGGVLGSFGFVALTVSRRRPIGTD